MLFHLSPGPVFFQTFAILWLQFGLEIPSHLKKSSQFFFWILQYFCFSLLLKYPGVNFLIFILRLSLSPWQARDYPLMLHYLSNPSGVCKFKATLLKKNNKYMEQVVLETGEIWPRRKRTGMLWWLWCCYLCSQRRELNFLEVPLNPNASLLAAVMT